MTRIVFLAIVGALAVDANQASAEPNAEVLGSSLPRSELAVEFGLVKSFLQRTRRLGHVQSGATELELGTAEAACWLFRFSRASWFGPWLGAEQYFNNDDQEDYLSHTVHAGGMLVVRPGELSGFRPRVIVGLAVAWEHLSPPQSFEIEQQIDSAFGAMWTAGLGIERVDLAGTRRWSLDLSLGQCSFGHAHSMLDRRTNERVSEQVQALRDNVMLQFGVGWFRGG
jgi:hypothetical protein